MNIHTISHVISHLSKKVKTERIWKPSVLNVYIIIQDLHYERAKDSNQLA